MNSARFDQRSIVWFSVFLAAGTFAYLLRAVDYFTAVPGDLNDARFNSVILEHVFQWVTGKVDSLWSPPFFYPFENVLAFSDNHFGSSPFYILFRMLGLSREIAFDAWFIAGFVLSYLAAFIAARRLSLSPLAAATCAFVFAFALPAIVREGHAQLSYRFAIPLAFGALLQMFEERRVIVAGRVAFWTAVQFYCSIYLGVFLVYLLAAAMIVALVRQQGPSLARSLVQSLAAERLAPLVKTGVVLVASAGAVALLLYKYKIVAASYGFAEPTDVVASMLPRPSSYLLAEHNSLYSWIGRWFDGIPMRHEQQLFVGLAAVLLGVIGATWKPGSPCQRLAKRLAIGALVILVVLTVNVAGNSIYLALIKLPGLSAIRAVTRVILIMVWPAAILAGLGVERLLHAVEGRRCVASKAVLLVAWAIMVLEVASHAPYQRPVAQWRARHAHLKSLLPVHLAPSSILYVTGTDSEEPSLAQLDSMVVSQDLGIPTLNGYSGRGPPGLLPASPCTSERDPILVYGVRRGWTGSEIDDLARRVVLVERSGCEDGVATAFVGLVRPEQAKSLELRIDSGSAIVGQFRAKVALINRGAESFSTRHAASKNILLAWRFVPITPDGQPTESGWSRFGWRFPAWTLMPGDSREAVIQDVLPNNAGRYQFEVTLLQIDVAWLHGLGLKVPSVEVVVQEPK